MTKQNRTLWIVLGIIVVAIATLSILSCVNTNTKIGLSDFKEVISWTDDSKFDISDSRISSNNSIILKLKQTIGSSAKYTFGAVKFDGYNLSFTITSSTGNKGVTFTSTYGRTNMSQ